MSNFPAISPVALAAGAATVDITPRGPVFLYGYPHVPRYSTGIHDPLECTALFLQSAEGSALFLASDVIFFSRQFASEVRRRIRAQTGVPEEAIVVAATHTHSGPILVDCLSHAADPAVPKPDPRYLAWLADRVVAAACGAVGAAVPAEIGLAVARAQGVGSNRHDPSGPTDPEVPVLVARSVATGQALACLVVYGMHPTVLHEDSTLISADFPGFTRRFLRRQALPASCAVAYLNGAAGNQSPRHMTRANTLAEAGRLGENLGRAIAEVIPGISFRGEAPIRCRRSWLDLEPRQLPGIAAADRAVEAARARFTCLQQAGAPRQSVRTAECDVFGAEETAALARAAADGRLAAAIETCVPAEIQLIQIGPWNFAAWPGEHFVEYGLALKARAPDTFLITLANGELQGYIATADAAARGAYESANAVFAPGNGPRFVESTLSLLAAAR